MNKKFKKILTLSLGISSMVAVGMSVASCTTIIKPDSGTDENDSTVLNSDLSSEILNAQKDNAWKDKKFSSLVSDMLKTPEARDSISKSYVDNLLYKYFSSSIIEEDKKVFDDAVKSAESKYKNEEERIKLAHKDSFERAFQLQFLDKNGGNKDEFIKREISSKLRSAFTDKFIGSSDNNNLRYGLLEKDDYKINNPYKTSDSTEINAGKRVTHSANKVTNVETISKLSDIENGEFGWGILKESSSWTEKEFKEIAESDKKKIFIERSVAEFQKNLYEKWFEYERPLVVKTSLFKSMNSIVNGAEDSEKEAAKKALEKQFTAKYPDSTFTDYDKLSSLNVEDKDNEVFAAALAFPLFRDKDSLTGNSLLDDKNNNPNIYYENWKEIVENNTDELDDLWKNSQAITMDSAATYIRSINASSSDSSLNSNGILNQSDNFASEFSVGILHSLNNTSSESPADSVLENFEGADGKLDSMYKNVQGGWTLVRDSFGVHAIKAEKQTSENFLKSYMKATISDENAKAFKTEFKLVDKMKKYFQDNQDELILEFFTSNNGAMKDYINTVQTDTKYDLDNDINGFVQDLAQLKRHNNTFNSIVEGAKSKLQKNISDFNIYQFNHNGKGIYSNIYSYDIPGSDTYDDYYNNLFSSSSDIKPASWDKPTTTNLSSDVFGDLSTKDVVFGDGSDLANKERKSDTLFFKVEDFKDRILNVVLDDFRIKNTDLYSKHIQSSFEKDLFEKVYDTPSYNDKIKYDEWMKKVNNLDTLINLANSSDKDLSWYGQDALSNSELYNNSIAESIIKNNNIDGDIFINDDSKEIRDKNLLYWLGQTAYTIETKDDKKTKKIIKYNDKELNNLQNILLKKLLDDPLFLWVEKKESSNPSNIQLSTGLGTKNNPSGIFGTDSDSLLSKEKYSYDSLNSKSGFVGLIDKNNKNKIPSGLNIDSLLNSNIESLKANKDSGLGLFTQFKDFDSIINYINSLEDFSELNNFVKFISNKLKDFSSVSNKLFENDETENKFSNKVKPILDLMKDDAQKEIASQLSESILDDQTDAEISIRNLFNNLVGNGKVSISNTKEIKDAKAKTKLLAYVLFKNADGDKLSNTEVYKIKEGAKNTREVNVFNKYNDNMEVKNDLGREELSANISNTDFFKAQVRHVTVDDILNINYEDFTWDGVTDDSEDLFNIVYSIISESKIRNDFLSFYLKDAQDITDEESVYLGYSKKDIFERSVYESLKNNYLFKEEDKKES
jgi:hypothetical protein